MASKEKDKQINNNTQNTKQDWNKKHFRGHS